MGRTLSGVFPTREQQREGVCPAASKASAVPLVCVAVENVLAGQYLLHLLSRDRSLEAVLSKDLLKWHVPGRQASLFILDCNDLDATLEECLRMLNARYVGARHIALGHGKCFEEIMQAMALGIHGFIPYQQVKQSLLPAIHSILEGKLWISNCVLQTYVQRAPVSILRGRKGARGGQAMTKRESQVAELAKRRLSNKEIANLLNIQESTVKFHLSNIFSKLQIAGRDDLWDKPASGTFWSRVLAS